MKKQDIKLQRRNKNLENVNTGIYPGARDIVCAVDCNKDQLINKQTIKLHSRKFSNASYQEYSGMKWNNKIEFENRRIADMQNVYDQIETRNVFTILGMRQYMNSMTVLTQRDRVRRQLRENPNLTIQPIRDINDQWRTIVAYGDASLLGSYKGHDPIQSRMENVYYLNLSAIRQSMLQCNHRKIKHKDIIDPENGRPEKCYYLKCSSEDDDTILHRTSECFERQPSKYWNRDINAACNIRNIVTQYITANYNLDSRPEQLSRRRQDVAPNEES
ncbi:hypothetical protein INT48_006295 [Thamnidium elegans]|uniref:Uncharacterized protein n=1 Tax=Thamnidium elegans TaxID=101142 RepID=A0A8H7SRI3_9FUNG|nr:hypothetical protein INT48_006295 [Thamnidium elegans]